MPVLLNSQPDIKFRAWHKEHKYITEIVGIADVEIHGDWVNEGRYYTIRRKHNHATNDPDYFEKVQPVEIIVMQYTGHNDMAGREIYAGDIFELQIGGGLTPYSDSKKTIKGVVYWEHENCGWWLDLTKPASQQTLLPESPDLWVPGSAFTGFYGKRAAMGTVIGNIYENRDLLK